MMVGTYQPRRVHVCVPCMHAEPLLRSTAACCTQVPMVVVGNKCDLETERQVSQDEGKELAASYGCPWMETSALAEIRCEDCFYELVREIRKDTTPKVTAQKKKSGSKCVIL